MDLQLGNTIHMNFIHGSLVMAGSLMLSIESGSQFLMCALSTFRNAAGFQAHSVCVLVKYVWEIFFLFFKR